MNDIEIKLLVDYFPFLHDLNILSITIRLVLCIICGGIVGLERIRKSKPMGIRTHVIVTIGATITMMTSQYISQLYETADPGRLGAQVVSGIGFLGAGAIMINSRHKVKGITTAAGLWTSACIGLSIGIGFYELAILGTLLILFTELVLGKLNNYVLASSPIMEIYVEFKKIGHFSDFITKIKEYDIEVTDIDLVEGTPPSTNIGAIVTINTKMSTEEKMEFTMAIKEMNGIKFVEKL